MNANRTFVAAAAAAAALLAAFGARAQDQHFSGAHVAAGVSHVDVSVDQPLYEAPGRLKASETGTGYRLAAGYDWRFGGLVVGGELGTRFGGSTVEGRVGGVNAEASSGSWDYSVRAGAVLGERTLVYGRVGGARTRMRQSITPVGATTAQRKTGTADGLMYGVGAEYALSDAWAVRGEWSRVDGEGDSRRTDYAVSAVFRF